LKETETKEHKRQLLKALEANEAIECGKCGYGWIPRVKQPKSCPRCKTRFDYPKP
jgi:rubrerythrin